jgi:hypothetical protein
MSSRRLEEFNNVGIDRNLQERLPDSEEAALVLLELQEPYMFINYEYRCLSYEYRCLSCTNPYSGVVYTLTSLRRKDKFLSHGITIGEQVLKTEDNTTMHWFKLCSTP